jgi:hypothetical protein
VSMDTSFYGNELNLESLIFIWYFLVHKSVVGRLRVLCTQ